MVLGAVRILYMGACLCRICILSEALPGPLVPSLVGLPWCSLVLPLVGCLDKVRLGGMGALVPPLILL